MRRGSPSSKTTTSPKSITSARTSTPSPVPSITERSPASFPACNPRSSTSASSATPSSTSPISWKKPATPPTLTPLTAAPDRVAAARTNATAAGRIAAHAMKPQLPGTKSDPNRFVSLRRHQSPDPTAAIAATAAVAGAEIARAAAAIAKPGPKTAIAAPVAIASPQLRSLPHPRPASTAPHPRSTPATPNPAPKTLPATWERARPAPTAAGAGVAVADASRSRTGGARRVAAARPGNGASQRGPQPRSLARPWIPG